MFFWFSLEKISNAFTVNCQNLAVSHGWLYGMLTSHTLNTAINNGGSLLISHNPHFYNKRMKVWNQVLHNNPWKKGDFKNKLQYPLPPHCMGETKCCMGSACIVHTTMECLGVSIFWYYKTAFTDFRLCVQKQTCIHIFRSYLVKSYYILKQAESLSTHLLMNFSVNLLAYRLCASCAYRNETTCQTNTFLFLKSKLCFKLCLKKKSAQQKYSLQFL